MELLKKIFGRFMVKDYVKSVKGTGFPRFFGQSIDQETFDRWIEVFYKYRGDLLTGEICIKEYLNLKLYGDTTNEYRVFKSTMRSLQSAETPDKGIIRHNRQENL